MLYATKSVIYVFIWVMVGVKFDIEIKLCPFQITAYDLFIQAKNSFTFNKIKKLNLIVL